MTDLTERIKALLPAQQDALFRRLRGGRGSPGAAAPAKPKADANAAPGTAAASGAGDNLELACATAGDFASLGMRPIARPEAGPGEIVIKTRAAALNFRDVMIALGLYPTADGVQPAIGTDCAGEVHAVGHGVTDLREGDRVMAIAPGIATYARTTAAFAVRVPPALSFEDAACIPTVFVTAAYALEHLAATQRGERVLVHSAAGGVGLAAMQILRRLGAEIWATSGTADKRRLLRERGIEQVMDSRSLAFADDIMKATRGQGVDVVLNSLAGEAIPKGLSVLAPGGRFIELGKRDIYADAKIGLRPFAKGLSLFSVELSAVPPRRIQAIFADLARRFESGEYEPLAKTVFDTTRLAESFTHLSRGDHVGKVALTFP